MPVARYHKAQMGFASVGVGGVMQLATMGRVLLACVYRHYRVTTTVPLLLFFYSYE